MFSFHKPRVYRSSDGCCICRAKSSSSRFTDSRKYELDSVKCFALEQPRQGEICNACVLLVKRYKRLPHGSNRHWGHVVDARAGPGTKSMSKNKRQRDERSEHDSTVANTAQPSSTNKKARSNSNATQNKSVITEKFNKIFKKSRKAKTQPEQQVKGAQYRQPISCSVDNNIQRMALLPPNSHAKSPNSLGSDYEESVGSGGNLTAGTAVVQFQTQTRAAAHRSRHGAAVGVGVAATPAASRQVGSRRRKYLPPRKHRRRHFAEQVPYYDPADWRQCNSCCGSWLECETLADVLLIDMAQFKPCAEHRLKHCALPSQEQPLSTPVALVTTTTPIAQPVATAITTAPTTTALKKHHLFYKRQSELFPQGDGGNYNSNNNNTHIAAAATTTSALEATVISSAPPASPPRHSTNVTISAAQSLAVKSHNFLHKKVIKVGGDATGSKIVKHSATALDKMMVMPGAAAALRSGDIKHLLKQVDKAYVLASCGSASKPQQYQIPLQLQQQQQQPAPPPPSSSSSSSSSSSTTTTTTATITTYGNGGIVAVASPSPTLSSSSSSSSSTKFSDNSSDSGFDENLLERKSASPLQEDTERKLLTRPGGVSTMFLASGIQIQGQQQNLQLAGNEMAVKLLQTRKQTTATTTTAQSHGNRSTAIKTGQGVGVAGAIGVVGAGGGAAAAAHSKMRAIYNNNNTIQHENGVTTIVPACSLAASTQTAAMHKAVGPSTVTITPAPHHAANANNNHSSKLPSAAAASATTAAHFNAIQIGKSNNNNIDHQATTAGVLNHKIILVKAAAATTTGTKFNSNSNYNTGNNHNNNIHALCAPPLRHTAAMQIGTGPITTTTNAQTPITVAGTAKATPATTTTMLKQQTLNAKN